ncbi:MAG: SIMPL domain-containing protein [Acidobacteriota bacterium]|jgi:uncharacterized protein YggE
MRRAVRSIAAAFALLLFTTSVAGAQMNEPDETKIPAITVSGSGEVRVEPDEAVVRVGVLAEHEDAAEAQDRANRIARGILDGVSALGVPDEAVRTSRLVLSPVYDQPQPQQRPRQPRIVAYRATNVVSVRLDDLAKIGPVIDAAIEADANQVEGVDFRLQDDRKARERALAQAVKDARSKAATIAAALGVDLGPVLEAHEGGISIDVPRFAAGPRMMAMEARAAEPTPVAAGDITVSASVTLRYRIGGSPTPGS